METSQTMEEFEHEAVSYHLNSFLEEIAKNREGKSISTGFSHLDEIFDGGLYPGLYGLGANSSLGKTSLLLQICNAIAQQRKGVLFFSLEMSRNELIAKSLSRLSMLESLEKYGDTKYAKTTRGILKGKYNEKESEIFVSCLKKFEGYGKFLHITEGIGNVGVECIKNKVNEYLKYIGEPPVVIIDYLQILAPYSEKMSDKQNVDKNILELKRMSRDFQIPVIGISSFNRENYKTPVSMASFKESGAIEYSSDVLIGLQYFGWDYQEKEKEGDRLFRLHFLSQENSKKAKEGKEQIIQLKVLKNRNGRRGSVLFNFYPRFNHFQDLKVEE